MKKAILFFLCVLGLQYARAQETQEHKLASFPSSRYAVSSKTHNPEDRRFFFGFRAGVSFTNLKGVKNFLVFTSPDFSDHIQMRLSPAFGGFVTMNLGLPVSFEMGAYYSEKGFELEFSGYSGSSFVLKYMDFPLLFRVNAANNLRLHAGIQYSRLIESRYNSNVLQSDAIAKNDIALALGASVLFEQRVVLGLNYDLGLLTLDPSGEADTYNRVFCVSMAYKF